MSPGVQRPASGVGVKQPVLVLPTDLVGSLHDEVEVRGEDQGFVSLLDAESEAALLLGQRSPGEGLSLSLRDDVFPEDGDVVEGVDDGVVVGEAEGDGGGVDGAGEAQTVAGDGDGGAEVELDGVVELVGVDAVDLRYVEVAVGGEEVEDSVEEFEEGETELRRED